MIFQFELKSREIRFDEEWNSALAQKQLEKFCLSIEFNFDKFDLRGGLLEDQNFKKLPLKITCPAIRYPWAKS